jgi:hypothetical protein
MIDPALLDPAAVSEETRAQNEEILAKLAALPDSWSFPPALIASDAGRGWVRFRLSPEAPARR